MAKLENDELIVRLDESNKNNEFLINDEKVKILEQRLSRPVQITPFRLMWKEETTALTLHD